MTGTELDYYVDNGCVFLPASGIGYGSSGQSPWALAGQSGPYWSATEYDSTKGYILYFYSSGINPSYSLSKSLYYTVRLVRDVN